MTDYAAVRRQKVYKHGCASVIGSGIAMEKLKEEGFGREPGEQNPKIEVFRKGAPDIH